MKRVLTGLLCFFALVAFSGITTAQPRNLIVVANNSSTRLDTLRLGTTYSLRWDTTASPVNTVYRVEFSANGQSGPWTPILVRNTTTQRSEPLIHTDGAAGNTAPGAGARTGRGISRLTIRLTTETATGYMRLVNNTDTTQTATSNRFVVLPAPPIQAVDSTLTGNIPAGRTVTLTRSKIYGLDGYVFVDSAAVLRIEPGTIVVGDTVGQNSALCVNRGGILFAQGTRQLPIVFTSRAVSGQRRAGDWGGLLIAGRARINTTSGGGGSIAFEGGIADGNGVRGYYGGTDDNDSSGVLEYVRVEFGGIAAFPNEELNGITLGGVGRRTSIRWVQSSFANDDGIEWFGGSVDAKYIISQNAIDDDFDTDYGFSGRIQFGLIIRGSQIADQSTSQAFESDNDPGGSFNTPLTSAIFSNCTVIGPLSDTAQVGGSGAGQWNTLFGNAAQIRRNSRQSIVNSVFIGWPRAGFELQGARTGNAALADSLLVRNNTWYGIKGTALVTPGGTAADPIPSTLNAAWFTDPSRGNRLINQSGNVDVYDEIGSAFGRDIVITNTDGSPATQRNFDPRPVANASFLTRASFERPATSSVRIDDSFFSRVAYQGAFDVTASGITNRWDLGWATYDPVNFPYRAGGPTSRVGDDKVPNTTSLNIVTFPNPATIQATVRYNLPAADRVTLRVHDALGNVIAVLANSIQQSEGIYEFRMDLSNLAPGMYMVQVATANGVSAQKFSVVR